MTSSFHTGRHLRPCLFLAVALLGLGACKSPEVASRSEADTQSDGAFLWRGFDHQWTYNHRLNRMGDFLQQEECTAGGQGDLPGLRCSGTVNHTGASGTGRDDLTFTSNYTATGSTEAAYHPAHAEIHLQGREQREIRQEQSVEVPAESDGNFIALLNGYDIRTAGKAKAKKIKRFRIWVSDEPTYDPSAGTAEFEVGAILDANCDSAECKTQRNQVHYQLDVDLLLIRSDQMNTKARRFETSYRWDKKNELKRDSIPLNRQRQGITGRPQKFDKGLVGFREIDFNLAKKGKYKDHWFVQWQNSIEDVKYQRNSGRTSFDLTLFFKEWNAKTKKKALSLARPGDATLSSEIILIQLPGGRVSHKSESGSLTWRGKNRSPDDPAAEWTKDLQFEF